MKSEINWILKKFEKLSTIELYAILQLRNEVFVVEQNCVFQDADDKDQSSWHFMGWEGKKLIAYARIVPPGLAYDKVSIGRVVTSPIARNRGLGKILMEETILRIEELFGKTEIKLGAQRHLENFYIGLGFRQNSEVYLEDGIEHVGMIRLVQNA